jgi:hypothetical protein
MDGVYDSLNHQLYTQLAIIINKYLYLYYNIYVLHSTKQYVNDNTYMCPSFHKQIFNAKLLMNCLYDSMTQWTPCNIYIFKS